MSSTRNKRKRPENDNSAIAPASRRRSRESRAVASETAAQEAKNEDTGKPSATTAQGTSAAGFTTANADPTSTSVSIHADAESMSAKESSQGKAAANGARDGKQETPPADRADPGAGPSSEEYSTAPKKPLHVSEAKHDSQAASTQTLDPAATDQASRIRGLINHRALLLARIRLCRNAADKRLQETKAAATTAATTMGKKSAKSGGGSREMTDHEEIQAHKDMAKFASQAAKKSRGEGGEGQADKRISLSLRKGSSVGKRMNAALSSLAPGVGTGGGPDGASPFPMQTSSGPTGKPFSKSPASPSSNIHHQTILNAAILQPPGALPSKIFKAPSSQNMSSSKQAAFSSTDGPKSRPSNLKSIKSLSGQVSRAQVSSKMESMSMHMNPGQGLSAFLPNRLPQPKVNFPEAVSLREERESIQAKLKTLLERQRIQTSGGVDGIRRAAVPSSALEIKPPVDLPRRRKTQWDRVLEEMNWLATDFIEERKWKMSCARIISSAISCPEMSIGAISAAKKASLAAKGDESKLQSANSVDKNARVTPTKRPSAERERKKMDERQYAKPSLEDTRSSRIAGKMTSCMVAELESAIRESGYMSSADAFLTEALDRYHQVRSNLLNGFAVPRDSSERGASIDTEKIIVDEYTAPQSEDTSLELSYNDITKRIEGLSRFNGKVKPKSSWKELSNAFVSYRLNLSDDQKEMIDFVDRIWKTTPSAGAVLSGPPTSGKTVATSSLLWKQQQRGPQLLVCPPTRMSRWEYEIGRFKQVRVLRFGVEGGISSVTEDTADETFLPGSCDVLLCEYAAVGDLLGFIRQKKVDFFSIVVDCRCPEGMLASLSSVESSSPCPHRDCTWSRPTELITTKWWHDITALVVKDGVRRLLLEYSGDDTFSLPRSGLGQRQQVEILSLRAAFIMGPKAFRPSTLSLQRTIISWARQKNRKTGEDKFDRVRRVLQEMIDPFCVSVDEVLASPDDVMWDLRPCEMSDKQRKAYNYCCLQVRGALASPLDDSSVISSVSLALLRLRRICCTSSGRWSAKGPQLRRQQRTHIDTVSTSLLDNEKSIQRDIYGRNPNSSQPNLDIALELIKSSGKFSELVSILKNECGYDFTNEEVSKALPGYGAKSKQSASKSNRDSPCKVVIFATLPRARFEVSLLLNSLGLRHESIGLRTSVPNDGRDAKKESTLAWIKSQEILVSFNTEGGADQKTGIGSGPGILIVSPESLTSSWGGLGIDSANVIIVFDEDWSGRGGQMLESSISRWQARENLKRGSSKVIRLICKDTIEFNIFRLEHDTENPRSIAWPIDQFGNFCLGLPDDDAFSLYSRSVKASSSSPFGEFPGLGIIRLSGEPLAEVLLSSEVLPPFFSSGSTMLFIPSGPDGDVDESQDRRGSKIKVDFLRALMNAESIAARENDGIRTFTGRPSRSIDTQLHIDSAPTFPEGIVSRGDLSSLQIRYFCERQCGLSVRTMAAGARTIVPPQLSETILKNRRSALTGSLVERGESERSALADLWHNSGLGSKPDDIATSLLCYRPNTEGTVDDHDILPSSSEPTAEKKKSNRTNAYSQIFSSAWDTSLVQDGSQGIEPVVFFPPLLPKIQYANSSTHRPFIRPLSGGRPVPLSNNHMASGQTSLVVQVKRKESDASEALGVPNTKRPRVDSIAVNTGTTKKGIDISDQDATASLAEISGPTETLMSNESEPTIARISSEEESRNGDTISKFDEDFGLLGAGVIPLPADSALLLGNESKGVGTALPSSSFTSDFLAGSVPCDTEESGSSLIRDPHGLLELVALFVKRRARGLAPPLPDSVSPLYRPPTGIHQVDRMRPTPQSISSLAPISGVSEDGGKKGKKKQSTQSAASSAFTRLPSSEPIPGRQLPVPIAAVQASGKDGYKHRMLASFVSRQFGTGLSMFESTSYRVANIQVLRRVQKRVDRLVWKATHLYETGPGLQLQIIHPPKLISDVEQGVIRFTSMVLPLKANTLTGDSARALAAAQYSTFRRSLVSPCRVDFGPFDCGFLASPSGMTGILPPRSRLGVSLPMGVKVPQSTRDQVQITWSPVDDKLLQVATVQFGMNWTVVARVLSGVENFVFNESIRNSEAYTKSPGARSSRQCRERWQVLARVKPDLASEVRKSEKRLRDGALNGGRPKSPPSGSVVRQSSGSTKASVECTIIADHFLFEESKETFAKSTVDDDTSQDEKSAEDKSITGSEKEQKVVSAKSRPVFTLLSSARTKRQVVPLNIPGVPAGSQPNQPVPSHPSHMQSVQSSVAAKWANGRTEMWPLQILDCADKHRAAARAAASTKHAQESKASAASGASARRQPVSNTANGRQPSSGSRSAAFPPVPAAQRPTSTTSSQKKSSAKAYTPPKTPAKPSSKSSGSPKGSVASKVTSKAAASKSASVPHIKNYATPKNPDVNKTNKPKASLKK